MQRPTEEERNVRNHPRRQIWAKRVTGLVEESSEAPFATIDQDPSKVFTKSYTKKTTKCPSHEKVTSLFNVPVVERTPIQVGASRLFDPEVYASNYGRSLSDRKESSLRNFAGSGDILRHHVQPSAKTRSDAIGDRSGADSAEKITQPETAP